ncbi:hypothetical protein MSAN_00655500 [Mycena sanguinolenta]|uniref:Uncharacterized protein n=1 Tax=Mycena sanguinolenta TaxID=230812 RepID=A0A8H6Z4L1_9AGAR|nr:hypothetical protein MSAN_00655500 [Mycena sanguinolenta]
MYYNPEVYYYEDPKPYPDDPEPYDDDSELCYADDTYDNDEGPRQHYEYSTYADDVNSPRDTNIYAGAELDDGYHEDEAAWDVDRYALTQRLDYEGEEEDVHPPGDEVGPLGAGPWHGDDDPDPHAVDYGESTAWERAWMDGPPIGECPDVWEGSMAQWRDHILAAHDVVAREVQCSEADDDAPVPDTNTVWMAVELAELQTALQRDDIPVAEREQLERTLAELWADELEHQRAVTAGYTWDEEQGDYWHPLHGYMADEEEVEVPTSTDKYEVAEESPPLFACTDIAIVTQVLPANPNAPAPMWQRILSLSPSLPRRPRLPHRHRTIGSRVLRHLPKSSLQKRAESTPTRCKGRHIAGHRASSCPTPQRDRPPHLPALDSDTSLTILHPLSLSLPSPKTVVVPREPGPPDIPRPSSTVLIVDPKFSPTPLDPVPTASTLLLAPSAQRRRNALRRLAKKGKG